jgi:hypothetical protein
MLEQVPQFFTAEPLVRGALASAQEQNMPGQSSAIKRTTERKIYPAHGDPIRVVPLNVPQELIGTKQPLRLLLNSRIEMDH